MQVGCGPRCLKKTLKHYGVEPSLEELAKLAGEENRETSLAGLARAARHFGFQATAEYRTVEEMFEHGKALARRTILHMNADHFVVLTDITEDEAVVNDPFDLKRVKTRYSRQELSEAWSGKLLVLRGQGAPEEADD